MNPSNTPNQAEQQHDGSNIHPMVVLQPGEKVICEIKRHPFGIIGQYIVAGLLIIAALAVAVVLTPQLSNYGAGNLSGVVYGVVALLIVIALVFLAISNSIYWKNQWIVTSDSITQILQPSLFGKQVSQLSMDDLEDVTVIQTGMLQSMFNFGTLKAETAGERSKFMFIYCPNPDSYARQILQAREEFMNFKRYNEGAQHGPAPYYASGTQPPETQNQSQPTPPSSRP